MLPSASASQVACTPTSSASARCPGAVQARRLGGRAVLEERAQADDLGEQRAGDGEAGQRHAPQVPDDRRVAQHVERLGGERAQGGQRERDHLARAGHCVRGRRRDGVHAAQLRARTGRGRRMRPVLARAGTLGAVEALNFYNPLVADQLRSRRKTVTIRLGDKSAKYRKGLCLKVLCGQRFGPRTHVFDAVVDKVEVKRLGDVSPRELQHDNPELRTLDEFVVFLGQLYNRDVTDDDTVTVIHFSEIRPSLA